MQDFATVLPSNAERESLLTAADRSQLAEEEALNQRVDDYNTWYFGQESEKA